MTEADTIYWVRVFDVDRTDKLNTDEFINLIRLLTYGTPEDLVKQIFFVVDKNGDNVIDKAEISYILHIFGLDNVDPSLATTLLTYIDTNQDGFITADELVKYLLNS